ncbi:retropepsin-like aspartic protease family protein [Sphingosinicella sp.]|uniref:retropepsin-like aspartic protease family protein n=1 Tax=Sphingosinicella sp. TaxID=1917971 RepID=UPI0040381030
MSTSSGLFWAGIMLIGAAVLGPTWSSPATDTASTEDSDKPDQRSRVAAATTPSVSGVANQRITRSFDGHFYVTAQVNGAPIRFMIDTGASMVALSAEDADRANVSLDGQVGVARTAGGDVEMTQTRIDSITVGGLTARAVRGAVVDQLDQSLLGQSFLSQLQSVEISGDTMTLR